jgi:membrane protein YdbS with pleckstrin-like domain
VDELFAPPGNDWQPVSPKLAQQRRIILAVQALVVSVVGAVVLFVVAAPIWVVMALIVIGIAAVAWAWVLVGRSARSWSYAEREEDLYIKHGIMFRKLVTVPYGRMQYVDVHAGPLDQAFRIANLHLHTAAPGTSAHIPGLPAEEAARLRDRLTSLGETQAAGL